MKGLDEHPLCPMQCCMTGVVIDEVPKILAPIPQKMTHAIQVSNPFDTTHQIIIPLQITRVTYYLM